MTENIQRTVIITGGQHGVMALPLQKPLLNGSIGDLNLKQVVESAKGLGGFSGGM